MMAPGNGNGNYSDCVLIDLNTQIDFCKAEGAYPVANRDELVPALRRVIAWVKRNRIPVVSSVESHRLWEVSNSSLPALYCIDGTPGQRKVDFTLFPNRVWIEVDNTLTVPTDLFRECQQVIFRKRTDDLLANPKADRFLTHLTAVEFVLFGNCVESAVKYLTLGLLARNRRVTVVLDACGHWDPAAADLAVRQISAKGANLITVAELVERRQISLNRYSTKSKPNGSHNGNGSEHHDSNGNGSNGHDE
ncbi:MAG: isochorismatase family protein [Planctomycetota bacterium]